MHVFKNKNKCLFIVAVLGKQLERKIVFREIKEKEVSILQKKPSILKDLKKYTFINLEANFKKKLKKKTLKKLLGDNGLMG